MEDNKKFLITDAIVISIITLIAYMSAFAYELGYSNYFDIPREFISLNLVDIFKDIFSLSIVPFILYTMFVVVSLFYNAEDFFKKRLFMVAIILWLVLASPLILFIIAVGKVHDFTNFIPISFVFFFFPITLLLKRKNNNIVANFLHKFMGLTGLIIMFFIIYFPTVAYYLGNNIACGQEKFYIIEGQDSLVVLKIYDDKIITAPLANKNKIEGEIKVLNFNDGVDRVLKLEKVGPLTVTQ